MEALSYVCAAGATAFGSTFTAKERPVSKSKDVKKSQKKEPTKTLKEKRDAKKAKKEEKLRQGA